MSFEKGHAPSYVALAIVHMVHESGSDLDALISMNVSECNSKIAEHYELYDYVVGRKKTPRLFEQSIVATALNMLVEMDFATIIEDPFAGVDYKISFLDCDNFVRSPVGYGDLARNALGSGRGWLKRALNNISLSELPTFDTTLLDATAVPAADRIVTRTDNTQSFDDAVSELEKVIRETSSNNEFAQDEPLQRDALLADLKAGKELLSSDSFWLKSVWETVIKALKYLSDKFGDAALGAAASELLQLLLPLLGLG